MTLTLLNAGTTLHEQQHEGNPPEIIRYLKDGGTQWFIRVGVAENHAVYIEAKQDVLDIAAAVEVKAKRGKK